MGDGYGNGILILYILIVLALCYASKKLLGSIWYVLILVIPFGIFVFIKMKNAEKVNNGQMSKNLLSK